MRFSILGLTVFPYLAAASVALYGQCGGTGYTGETDCVSGAVCTYQNDYYSQCLAGTATTTTTKTTTTTSKTTTTTSKTTTTTTKSSTTTTKTSTSAGSSSTVPSGAITVGKNGEGKYTTLAAAIADTSSNIIYVYAGNYTEQITISRSGLTIYGATSNKLAYGSNTVTVSGNDYAGAAGSDALSATVRVTATGVKFYNLNIENTFGKPIDQAQAIALSVEAGTFACYACQIRGYQDTLLAESGTQFYGKCLIQGSVDFIFGQTASIWVTGGTINTVGSGYITASGRSSNDSNYYVIDSTTVTGSGSVYLGRPWGDYARVIFQNSVLGSNIVAAGWSQWSTSTPNTDHVTFGEYNNSGAGAWNSARASFATKLSAGISITTVLGSTSWIDSTYL